MKEDHAGRIHRDKIWPQRQSQRAGKSEPEVSEWLLDRRLTAQLREVDNITATTFTKFARAVQHAAN